MIATADSVIRSEGFLALWKGVGASLIRCDGCKRGSNKGRTRETGNNKGYTREPGSQLQSWGFCVVIAREPYQTFGRIVIYGKASAAQKHLPLSCYMLRSCCLVVPLDDLLLLGTNLQGGHLQHHSVRFLQELQDLLHRPRCRRQLLAGSSSRGVAPAASDPPSRRQRTWCGSGCRGASKAPGTRAHPLRLRRLQGPKVLLPDALPHVPSIHPSTNVSFPKCTKSRIVSSNQCV